MANDRSAPRSRVYFVAGRKTGRMGTRAGRVTKYRVKSVKRTIEQPANSSQYDSSSTVQEEHENDDEVENRHEPKTSYFLKDDDDVPPPIAPCKTLTLAGDAATHFFDTTVEASHEDDALRGVAAVVYWVRHQLSDSDVREYIAPARYATRSPNYELIRQRTNQWQTFFQGAIMKWYKKGVTKMCADMASFFEKATLKERHALWGSLFDKSRVQMAKGSLSVLASSISIDEIFSWNDTEHVKWQRFHQDDFYLCSGRYLCLPRVDR